MTPSNRVLFLAVLLASAAAAPGGSEVSQSSKSSVFHQRSRDIYQPDLKPGLFGYSIAYRKKEKELLVGSPKDGHTGGVYTCTATTKEKKCEKIEYNDVTKPDFTYWLGATVDTGDSFYMACAPRYPFTVTDPKFTSTKGHCYVKTDDKKEINKGDALEVSDTEKGEADSYNWRRYEKEWYYPLEYKLDSFGWSSHIHKTYVFVGSPVISTGRVFKYNAYKTKQDAETLPKILKYDQEALLRKGKLFSINFGYDITSGYFVQKPDNTSMEALAISTPYGSIGYGRVYFYDITGTKALDMWVEASEVAEAGSMFGACLASLPLSDSESALLVGAPAFTSTNDSTSYDVGAVFIYRFYPNSLTNYPDPTLVKKLLPIKDQGEDVSGGRFGASIVSIGDFDGDNIPEVAIAAPFAHNGRGAVYVYSSKVLLDDRADSNWMQRLLPEDMNSPSYFGLSLTALADSDGNGCNELGIGAPFKSSVILLHCIASVDVSFKLDLPNITSQAQQISSGHNTTFDLKPCLQINYGKIPNPKHITTHIEIVLKILHTSAAIADNKTVYSEKIRIDSPKNEKQSYICLNLKIYLPEDGDYDQKIKFEASASLIEEYNPLERDLFDPNLVLLYNGIKHTENISLAFPELPGSNLTYQIHTNIGENYTIGSTNDANLAISMTNSGNTAHGACVRVNLENIVVKHMPALNCSVSSGELRCNVDTLKRGQTEIHATKKMVRVSKATVCMATCYYYAWCQSSPSLPIISINVQLSMKSLTSSNKKLILSSKLYTSNCEIPTNLTQIIDIHLRKDENIDIKTSSYPSYVVNVTKQELNSEGKNIEHKYTIINNGVTLWDNLQCEILLPAQVTIQKVTVGSVTCLVKKNKSICPIITLPPNLSIDAIIQMKIVPNSDFAGQIKEGKETIETSLSLKGLKHSKTITTEVSLWVTPRVEVWMIVVAGLVGFVIISVLVWILHECNCLRRHNKEKLNNLKKDIHRQSMRKSKILSHDGTNENSEIVGNNDRQSLLSNLPDVAVSSDRELEEIQIALDKHRLSVQKNYEESAANEDKNQIENEAEKTKDVVIDKTLKDGEGAENNQSVKEISMNDNKPSRVTFNVELSKALAKGCSPIVTKTEVEIHADSDSEKAENVQSDENKTENRRSENKKHFIPKDPSLAALNAELSKALKDCNTVQTQAEVHESG